MHFFRPFAPILKITISETDSNLYLKNNGYGHPVRGNLKARKSSAPPGFQKYKLKINNSMYFSHRQKKKSAEISGLFKAILCRTLFHFQLGFHFLNIQNFRNLGFFDLFEFGQLDIDLPGDFYPHFLC